MAVESTSTYAGPYLANGIARAFPFNFRALTRDEVAVVIDTGAKQVLVQPSLYSVTLAAQSGTVTFTTPPAAGQRLFVVPNPSWKQEISFSNQAPFLPESHNEANDRAALRDLVLKGGVDRSLRLSIGEKLDPLGAPSRNPLKFIGTDENGGIGWRSVPPGKDAPRAQVAVFVTTAGQVRFPADGPLLDIHDAAFSDAIDTIEVSLNGAPLAPGADYTYDGGSSPVSFTSPQPADLRVLIIGQPQGAAFGVDAPLRADEVDVASYPGTSIADDPDRFDHDNARWMNAQADIKDRESPNFGKAARFFLGQGSGQLVLFKPNGTAVPQLDGSNDPADVEMNARVGDWLIDNWSPNGIVPDDYPASPIIPNPNDPGNWRSGVVIRASYDVRFRRPPRKVMRPFIFNCEPVPSAATTDPVTGIDTQSDVFVGNRIEGFPAFIGENHWRGYSQHANDIQVSGVTDFYAEVRGFGQQSDLLYFGATSVGGGSRNAHNKRIEYYAIADGYNKNNRNVVSVIDVDGEKGRVWARRFSKPGGPAPNDDQDPNTGVGAPGAHDAEPNASFTDDPIYRNSDVEISAEDCRSPGAIFLPENGSFPHPCQNIRRRVRHVRCGHGFISQTKSNPAMPYDIDVVVKSDQSDRPLEILSGGGKFVVHATDCPKATYVGYFVLTAGDLHLSGDLVRCGTASGVVIENRGWDGGSAKGLRILDSAGLIGIRHIPVAGQLTRGITFDGVEFDAGMSFAHYADIGADVRPGTIIERNARYNGNGNLRWAVPGTPLKNIPGSGAYVMGQEFPGDPALEPGAPRIIRALATNAAGTPPVMIQQEQIAGFVDPSGATLSGFTFTNMVQDKPGLLRATAASAKAVRGGVGSFTWSFRMPFSGNQTLYVGFADRPNPTLIEHLVVALWAGDTTGGKLGTALAIGSGAPASSGFPYKYGDPASVSFNGTPAASVTLNGQTIYSTGLSQSTLYPVVFIGTAGERVLITGAA